jgi:hypothetical protein
MAKTKSKKNYEKEVTQAVKSMVEFMKDEVDRSVAHLTNIEKLDRENAESVSNVIKSSIDASMMKTIEMVQRSVRP